MKDKKIIDPLDLITRYEQHMFEFKSFGTPVYHTYIQFKYR